jgi:hypothetical protein
VLTFLIQGEPWRPASEPPAEPEGSERGDWWNFERRTPHDPTHPAAGWVAHLLQEAASTPLPCPRCGVVGEAWRTLDHLLRSHDAGYAEAAAWLEEADGDLFSLAVHYLASKARAARPPCRERVTGERCSHRQAAVRPHRPDERRHEDASPEARQVQT